MFSLKKCLLLLTSEYPYGKAETFIESEINYHTDNFEKVIILSIDLQKNAQITRAVPESVDYYNVTPIDKKIGRATDVLLGTLQSFGNDKYYKLDKDTIGGSLSKRVFNGYFCHRAKRELKYCLDTVKKYDFSQYDEVVIYSYWMFVSSLIGIMLKEEISKECNNIRLVTRCHGYDVYEHTNKLKFLPMRKYILDNYDCIFPCSEFAKDYLLKKYPSYADKIKVSYLGTVEHGCREYSKKAGELRLVSCSNMVGLKQNHKIIEALSLLDDSDINIIWTHIGDGPLRSNLESLAKDKLKNINFNFLGHLSNCDVYEYYTENDVDLFVNTSSIEGLPVSIMEAISFGIPVVAPDVGGVSEIIIPDNNGKLLKASFEVTELAEYIKIFTDMDTQQIAPFRQNARLKWSENFNAEKNYSAFSADLSDT